MCRFARKVKPSRKLASPRNTTPIDQRLTQYAMQIVVRNEVCVKDIYVALVVVVIEDIVGLHSQGTLLFVSKYQVNPLVKVSTDVITLQGLETK